MAKAIIVHDLESVPCQNAPQLSQAILSKALGKQEAAFSKAQADLDAVLAEAEVMREKLAGELERKARSHDLKIEKATRDETKEKYAAQKEADLKEVQDKGNAKIEALIKAAEENVTCVNAQNDPEANPDLIAEFEKTGVVSFRCGIFCICAKELISGRKFSSFAPMQSFLESEKKMIEQYLEWCKGFGPTWPVLTGFNIIGFDIPVMEMRCLYHDIQLPAWYVPKNKWKHPHTFDVMDKFTHWNAFGKTCASVHEALLFFDLPSHKGEMDGSKVWGEVKAGNYQKVVDYCKEDVEQEALLVRKFLGEIEGGEIIAEMEAARHTQPQR